MLGLQLATDPHRDAADGRCAITQARQLPEQVRRGGERSAAAQQSNDRLQRRTPVTIHALQSVLGAVARGAGGAMVIGTALGQGTVKRKDFMAAIADKIGVATAAGTGDAGT